MGNRERPDDCFAGWCGTMKNGQRFAHPSRTDAKLMTRSEKRAMPYLMSAVGVLEEVHNDLRKRLEDVENGNERMDAFRAEGMKLLEEIRVTIPEEQRWTLANMALDMEMRLMPKQTPSSRCSVVPNEDLRTLIDAAQAKCAGCADDSEECKKCKLFRLLVKLIPLERYDSYLCPYNLAAWED